MSDTPLLRDLGFILAAAAGVGLLARALRLPPIVAYMAAGLLLGPVTGVIHDTAGLELISEAGIALLLFLVGLELSLAHIREVGRVALGAGIGQMAATALLGCGLALALGFPFTPAALLALALTFSSTVVVVKLLDRRRELDSTHGRIAVAILLVQDVAVAVALTLLAGLGDPGALGVQAVGRGLLRAGLGMAALVAALYVAVRFLLPPLLRWLAPSLEALFVWSLTVCFGFILAAKALGLSIEIGAFLAGVGLAQLPLHAELGRRVQPLASFFLAVFFVILGIHLDPAAAFGSWPAVLALSAFVVLGKPAILMALIPRFGYPERPSFLAALSLGQASEFSFIVAGLAFGAGLVDPGFLSLVGAVGLLSIGASAALIQGADRLYAALRGRALLRLFRAPASPEAPPREGPGGHVIVVGMNTLGRRLVHAFVARGERVLAVDVDAAKLLGLPCDTLQGSTDHPAVLERAGLRRARLLVSALQIEEANELLAYRAREAGVPSSIHAFDAELADELRARGATHVMVSKYDGIRQVAEALRSAGVIG